MIECGRLEFLLLYRMGADVQRCISIRVRLKSFLALERAHVLCCFFVNGVNGGCPTSPADRASADCPGKFRRIDVRCAFGAATVFTFFDDSQRGERWLPNGLC